MISFEYNTVMQIDALLAIANKVDKGVRQTMQIVLDELVANIKGKFTDTELANTVIGYISRYTREGSDILVEGKVTSTWQNMKWYESGRPPGGKMPPIDAMLGYIKRHNIQPDPEKTFKSFAYAVNFNRVNKRSQHALPLDVIVQWAKDKPVDISKEFALRSLAFAIGKKIQRDGIPGKHYFEKGLAESLPRIHRSFESVVVNTANI